MNGSLLLVLLLVVVATSLAQQDRLAPVLVAGPLAGKQHADRQGAGEDGGHAHRRHFQRSGVPLKQQQQAHRAVVYDLVHRHGQDIAQKVAAMAKSRVEETSDEEDEAYFRAALKNAHAKAAVHNSNPTLGEWKLPVGEKQHPNRVAHAKKHYFVRKKAGFGDKLKWKLRKDKDLEYEYNYAGKYDLLDSKRVDYGSLGWKKFHDMLAASKNQKQDPDRQHPKKSRQW